MGRTPSIAGTQTKDREQSIQSKRKAIIGKKKLVFKQIQLKQGKGVVQELVINSILIIIIMIAPCYHPRVNLDNRASHNLCSGLHFLAHHSHIRLFLAPSVLSTTGTSVFFTQYSLFLHKSLCSDMPFLGLFLFLLTDYSFFYSSLNSNDHLSTNFPDFPIQYIQYYLYSSTLFCCIFFIVLSSI